MTLTCACYLEGSARGQWTLAMLAELGSDPRVLWGASFLGSEFRVKNLHDGSDGIWALGRDMRVSLPGVFWANVFGAPYLALIGRDRLTTAPAWVVAAGENVLLVVHDEPEEWALPSAAARSKLVAGHIGAHYFFDRHTPDRQTRAPDFGLRPLADGSSLLPATACMLRVLSAALALVSGARC